MDHRPFLESALDAEIVHQVREASNFTPRYVVLSRVVETVCHHLNLPLAALPDYKNTIRLDAETKRYIEEYWYLHAVNVNDTTNDTELEKILAKDYHKPSDLFRFVGILSKRASKQTNTSIAKLYEILAMDGYLGTDDPKRYVEYLKIASSLSQSVENNHNNDSKLVHVRAVRQLYSEGVVQTPSEMYDVLKSTFEITRPCDLAKFEEAKVLYSTLVGDAFDSIREWKLQQEKEEEESKRKKEGGKRKNEPEPKPEPTSLKKRARKNENPMKAEALKEEKEKSLSSESEESIN